MKTLPPGMYQQCDSLLHRMNPVYKILCFLLLVAAVISTGTIVGYLLIGTMTGVLLWLSRLSPRQAFSAVLRMRWFFLTILLMNCCFYSREDAWFRFWLFTPSPSGLMQGVHVCARVILVLILSNLLTGSTAPMTMTDALQRIIEPLSFLGLPTAQIALILSVSIQFIPILLEETDLIKKAQTARGAAFDSPRLVERITAVPALALPVFLSAFKRADELSLAMEARGYRTDQKGRRKEALAVFPFDRLAVLFCLAVMLAELLFL